MILRTLTIWTLGLTVFLSTTSSLEAMQKAKAKSKAKRDESPAAAAKAIEQLGGIVEHLEADPKQPVVAIRLAKLLVTPAHLSLIADFSELRILILREGSLDNTGLASLTGLSKLEVLDIEYTPVTDPGLNVLKSWPNLKEVYLTGSAVTEKGVMAIRKQLPNVTVFWLPPLPKLASAAAYLKFAKDIDAKGETVQATRALTQALSMDPKLAEAYEVRGWMLIKEDEPGLAKADFEQLVKLKPQSGPAWSGLAMATYLTGDSETSLAHATKALKLDNSSAEAYYVRGMVRYDNSEFRSALPDFEQAVELSPDDAANHERLGWTYLELKEFQNALPCFEQALKLDPEFEHAYYGRGLYYMTMKKPNLAVPDFAKAAALDPEFPDYFVDLALAQAQAGDFAAAVKTQQKVLLVASEQDQPEQQRRLQSYQARRLPVVPAAGKATIQSASKPGSSSK